jgi:hypothetical protein
VRQSRLGSGRGSEQGDYLLRRALASDGWLSAQRCMVTGVLLR